MEDRPKDELVESLNMLVGELRKFVEEGDVEGAEETLEFMEDDMRELRDVLGITEEEDKE